jgi:hypothetical protein
MGDDARMQTGQILPVAYSDSLDRSPAYVAFPSAKSQNPRRANADRHITRATT